jgi:hypothetical protein
VKTLQARKLRDAVNIIVNMRLGKRVWGSFLLAFEGKMPSFWRPTPHPAFFLDTARLDGQSSGSVEGGLLATLSECRMQVHEKEEKQNGARPADTGSWFTSEPSSSPSPYKSSSLSKHSLVFHNCSATREAINESIGFATIKSSRSSGSVSFNNQTLCLGFFPPRRHSSTAAAVEALPSDGLPSWESGTPPSRSRSQSNSFYDVTVEKYAAKPLSTLTLKKMLSFGENAGGDQLERKIIKSAQFVQSELPVRLAKRLLDLQLLPYIVVTNPHIKRVYDAYHRAFLLLKEFPEVTNMEQNQYLTQLLTKVGNNPCKISSRT